MKKTSDTEEFGMVFRADGSVVPMPEPADEGKFSLEQLQEAVGGYIEVVPGHPIVGITKMGDADDMLMLANEEGLLKGLPANQTASMMAGRVLVGDVAVIPSRRMD